MCLFCADKMKHVRVLLAAKAIGWLPKEDDTDLDSVVEKVIWDHAKLHYMLNEDEAVEVYRCSAIRANLYKGIRKVLPSISIEDRFKLALQAGAVKL